MNKLFIQEDGLILAFTALVLPVFLLIGALLIDGGQLYMRHGEIEHLSRQSGQSGLLAFSNVLSTQAKINHTAQCTVEIPPSKCDSTSLFDFLTAAEIDLLINDATHQSLVTQNTTDFGTQLDPRQTIADENFEIVFPYLYEPGATQVKIWIKTSVTPELILSGLLPAPTPITYQSVAYLPLQ